MTPNQIYKVLSTIRKRQVRALLMGGQACILYGAAEFSRDTDLALAAEPGNLSRLQEALDELQAQPITVPPFEMKNLQRGHAVHFRCRHPDALNTRLDLMAVMRGVDSFDRLWSRRTTSGSAGIETIEAISLPDLVQAKKTQQDKDWPMIRRLVDVNYLANRSAPTPEQVVFWLKELRTPVLLQEAVSHYPNDATHVSEQRTVLSVLLSGGSADAIEAVLQQEEWSGRQADRAYWQPLKAELEQLRHSTATAGVSPRDHH